MDKLFDNLQTFFIKILENLIVFSIMTMSIAVIYQVISRWCGAPSKISEEIATILMIWIGTFGAALGFQRGSHLGIDILSQLLNKQCQKLMEILTILLILSFAIIIWIYGGSQIVKEAFFNQNMLKTIPSISRGWVYLPLPISGVLVAFFTLNQLRLSIKKDSETEVKHG